MNKSWLDKKIHEAAITRFESNEPDFDNEELRLAWQKVKSENSYKQFKEVAIKCYEKEITQNVIYNAQGLADLIKEQGEK